VLGLASNREMATPAPIGQSSNHSKDVIVSVSSMSVDLGQHAVCLQTGQRMFDTNSVATQASILSLLLGRERVAAAGAVRLVEELVRPVFLDALVAAVQHGAAGHAVQRGAF